MTKKVISGVGISLALVLAATSVNAQDFGPTNNNTSSTPSTQGGPGEVVLLAEYVRRCTEDSANYDLCERPRAARESTFAPDTPIMDRARFNYLYPHMGDAGFDHIRGTNFDLCTEVREIWQTLLNIDEQLISADAAYAELTEIYNALPDHIRGATRVVTIGAAAQAGALCLVSGGGYCIAAIVGAVSHVFGGVRPNQRVTIANIRLSLANIMLSRVNITLQRVNVRMSGIWLRVAVPACMLQFGSEGWFNDTNGGQFRPLTFQPQW